TRPGNIHEQNILAVLLRTKLAPEIEEEEEEIWAQVHAEMQRDRSLDWFARAEKQESLAITAINSFVELRSRHTESVGSALAGMVRRSESSAHRDNEDAADQHRLALHDDEGDATKAEKKQTAAALEDILAFMSSG
ncbi:hypothetical protein EV175_006325, partial [Coemansia sp. RSA 1933]